MSEVEEDKDGVVAAQEVANAVAGVMCALEQLHIRQHAPEEDETVTVFKAAREMEGSSKVAGLNADEFTVSRQMHRWSVLIPVPCVLRVPWPDHLVRGSRILVQNNDMTVASGCSGFKL